ncbi:MAG: alanine racemase [Lachnospiraceae bacterium]
MNEYNRVCAKIDLNAVVNNVEYIERHCYNKQILAVIKADGYGHGAIPIAKLLEKRTSIYGFAVATIEEAVELRKAHIKKTILVLGHVFPYGYDIALEHNITLTVFREDMLEEIGMLTNSKKKTLNVHLKVDTGMGRIGIRANEESLSFVKKIKTFPYIQLNGIFTHFAKADEKDKTHVYKQQELFEKFVSFVVEKEQLDIPFIHSFNSAGILSLNPNKSTLVRAGIILYGLWPSEKMYQEDIPLKPALSLISHIVYIKTIYKGETVSYGGTFIAKQDTIVATIPLGYADGYPRSLSNKGYVLIKGKKAPIIGRICMDQFMVDITNIENVSLDEEVVLIGKSGDIFITMEELAQVSGRFNYEFACNISKRVKRVYI